jgi:hypothetical protein
MVAVAPSAAEAAEAAEPAAGASVSAVVTAGARTVATPAAATAIELRIRNKRRLIAPIGGFLSTRWIDLHEVNWSFTLLAGDEGLFSGTTSHSPGGSGGQGKLSSMPTSSPRHRLDESSEVPGNVTRAEVPGGARQRGLTGTPGAGSLMINKRKPAKAPACGLRRAEASSPP